MTKAQLEEELLKLPYEERLEIADMLVASEESPPLHDWHKRALDQALEDYRQQPGGEQSWEEIKAETRKDG